LGAVKGICNIKKFETITLFKLYVHRLCPPRKNCSAGTHLKTTDTLQKDTNVGMCFLQPRCFKVSHKLPKQL